MFRIVAMAACMAASSCAGAGWQPVMPEEFEPHGRFAATAPRDQAFLECKIVAENAGRMAQASGAPGTLPQLYGIPPGVLRAVTRTMDTCMQSKGYRWLAPR